MTQIASCNLLEVCFRINYFEVTVACLLLKWLQLQTLTLLPRSSVIMYFQLFRLITYIAVIGPIYV